MPEQLVLTLVLLAAYTATLYALRRRSSSARGLPSAPIVQTVIPWLGAGIEFGWNSPKFFRRCMAKYGPDFQVTIAGTPFVFLSSPAALGAFYRNREQGLVAVRSISENGLGGKKTDRIHRVLNDVLTPIVARGNSEEYLSEAMLHYNQRLLYYLDSLSKQHERGDTVSLKYLTAFALWSSATVAIFGSTFPVHAFDDFIHIDDSSYYLYCRFYLFPWKGPHIQDRMRATLVDFMKLWKETNGTQDVNGVSAYGNEIMRALVTWNGSEAEKGGLLLAYLWGTFTNTIRVLFWLFAHLLSDTDAYSRIKAEVDQAVEEELPDTASLVTASSKLLNGPRFRLLDSALRETFRIHNLPTSYRTVSSEVPLPSINGGVFFVKPGDIVVANTYGAHWNEKVFPAPHEFRVDRFLDANLTPHLFMFGKGAHMCTGRHFAKSMMKMFVIMCLRYFDIEPAGQGGNLELPSENPRSVGMMLPNKEIVVAMRKRRAPGSSKG